MSSPAAPSTKSPSSTSFATSTASAPAAARTSLVKSLAYAAATLAVSTWALAMLWTPAAP